MQLIHSAYVLGLSDFTMVRDCSFCFFLSSSVNKNPVYKQNIKAHMRHRAALSITFPVSHL